MRIFTGSQEISTGMGKQEYEVQNFACGINMGKHGPPRVIRLNFSAAGVKDEVDALVRTHGQYDVVHVTAHGFVNGLSLCRESSQVHSTRLCRKLLSMVASQGAVLVLACCSSATLAAEISKRGPYSCVVGTDCDIPVECASKFSETFYLLWKTSFLDMVNRVGPRAAFVDLSDICRIAAGNCDEGFRLVWKITVRSDLLRLSLKDRIESSCKWGESTLSTKGALDNVRVTLNSILKELPHSPEADELRAFLQGRIRDCNSEYDTILEEEQMLHVVTHLKRKYAAFRAGPFTSELSSPSNPFHDVMWRVAKEGDSSFVENGGGDGAFDFSRLCTMQSVLVTGEVGSGKSTLLSFMSHSWAKGNLWQDLFSVILVKLNCLLSIICNRKKPLSWPEFVLCTVFDGNEEEREDANSFWSWCQRKDNGQRVMWLFDGYDEVIDSQCDLLSNIFRGDISWPCRYIVSCREGVERPPYAFLHLRIDGISPEFLNRQLKRAFPKDEDFCKIQQHVASNSSLTHLLQNPFHVELVCRVGHECLARGDRLSPALLYYQVVSQLQLEEKQSLNQVTKFETRCRKLPINLPFKGLHFQKPLVC